MPGQRQVGQQAAHTNDDFPEPLAPNTRTKAGACCNLLGERSAQLVPRPRAAEEDRCALRIRTTAGRGTAPCASRSSTLSRRSSRRVVPAARADARKVAARIRGWSQSCATRQCSRRRRRCETSDRQTHVPQSRCARRSSRATLPSSISALSSGRSCDRAAERAPLARARLARASSNSHSVPVTGQPEMAPRAGRPAALLRAGTTGSRRRCPSRGDAGYFAGPENGAWRGAAGAPHKTGSTRKWYANSRSRRATICWAFSRSGRTSAGDEMKILDIRLFGHVLRVRYV